MQFDHQHRLHYVPQCINPVGQRVARKKDSIIIDSRAMRPTHIRAAAPFKFAGPSANQQFFEKTNHHDSVITVGKPRDRDFIPKSFVYPAGYFYASFHFPLTNEKLCECHTQLYQQQLDTHVEMEFIHSHSSGSSNLFAYVTNFVFHETFKKKTSIGNSFSFIHVRPHELSTWLLFPHTCGNDFRLKLH